MIQVVIGWGWVDMGGDAGGDEKHLLSYFLSYVSLIFNQGGDGWG